MPDLPIRRMIVYKHGVGYFERRGAVSGAALRLSFPREAMDDVLKSLVALDLGAGQVLGIDFETPEDRAMQVARGSIHLSDNRSLLDLLRDLRGRMVRLRLEEERGEPRKGFGLGSQAGSRRAESGEPKEPAAPTPTAAEAASEARDQIEGVVIGVDVEDKEPLRAPIVSIYQPQQRRVRTLGVRDIRRLEVLDDRAAEDLGYFLRAAQSEEDRRAATLRLSDGDHDLLVGYIAPAPAWRVSYRILAENKEQKTKNKEMEAAEQPAVLSSLFSVLLQGWGLFDNQLDEDLEGVELTLVAGMPVSFRYRLYEPHTPERPLVADEERTVAAPVEFRALGKQQFGAAAPAAAPPMVARGVETTRLLASDMVAAAESSTLPVSVGEERGALFQYRVAHPVSVARGQSAMVPIMGQRLDCRKDLLYNGQKLPKHPIASLRMRNETGLTLERGPVTVIEEGDYAGEAVLPFTRAGGDMIVPYAVELGITVQEEHRGERRIGAIRIREDYLLVQEWDLQHTVYRIDNRLSKGVDVVVEQLLTPGYELTETRASDEQSQGLARWAVGCPAGEETIFAVHQRREFSRREQVRGLTPKQLHEFLRRRYLDEATYQALSDVLAIYGRIDAHQRRLAEIAGQRQGLFEQQRQIQGSLAPLGREGEEGALRARYVATLGDIEDRLAALAAEEQRLQAEISQLEDDAAHSLSSLASP